MRRNVHTGEGKREEHLQWGGGGGVSDKIKEPKVTSSRAVIKRCGWGFSPDETEEKCTQKKSLVVLFPAYLILPGNLKS